MTATGSVPLPVITWDMRARAALPDRLVPLVVRLRTRRMRRKPEVVAEARREMEHLIGALAPEDVDRAADAYIHWYAWRSEMRYHPEVTSRQRVDGMEHLLAASEVGRGVLLAFLHHGQYEGAMSSIARAGHPLKLLVDPMMLAPDAPKFLRQHVRSGTWTGCEPVSTTIGSQGIKDLLSSGESVAVAIDVPSRSRVSFLGRERVAASGIARIAIDTGAMVVTLRARCDGEMPSVELLPAVDPADHDSPEALLQHLLDLQEPAVLAWPEGYHQPLLRWGSPEGGRASQDAAGSG